MGVIVFLGVFLGESSVAQCQADCDMSDHPL